jgi:Na+-transporting methylmalonyl-CoA/oxaloacetate decarboxylase gamma subunit
MQFEMVLLLSGLAMVLTMLGLLIILMQEFNRQNSRKPSPQTFKRRSTGNKIQTGEPTRKGSVSRNTQSQLVRLLQGDRSAAMRLVDRERRRNSHRPEQWLWEKVVRDLERDRR